MARNQVTLQDAVIAVILTDSSMNCSSILGCDNALHSKFPEDPDAAYVAQEREVLSALGLMDLMPQGHDSCGNEDWSDAHNGHNGYDMDCDDDWE